ncbi:glycoside hydrolase family 97 protein [Pedobacter sp. GR22-6]|uniref:glycoside hydrolase family 97 protein n=1 Tax=Pedobacter sp. GR22-6 TaxID=3127957 RepID=UPI00307D3372
MKKITSLAIAFVPFIFVVQFVRGQEIKIKSPNSRIEVALVPNTDSLKSWNLKVSYKDSENYAVVIPSIKLGLSVSNASFADNVKFLKAGRPVEIHEKYSAIHGKRKDRQNNAVESTLQFINSEGNKMNVILRAYNNGIAFRYQLPSRDNERLRVNDELTTYEIKPESNRWLQAFTTSYEGFYPSQENGVQKGQWGYPGLFRVPMNKTECWMLISEAGLDSSYCATKFENTKDDNHYKLVFPAASDGNGVASVYPSISTSWFSPWRVVLIGSRSDLVQSTLIEDLSPASRIEDTSWIKPGTSSWVYWANNHGTMDYQKVKQYIDLAVRMDWPYTLFDWEWDQMGNGGDLENAMRYAKSRGIKPMIWYNSGGPHNKVSSTPRDRLLTHENRMKEFAWLSSLGVFGIKVDFFESDKQHMIKYYLDILEDAAKYKLMVNFHGSTVPRGWSRTYPNLMSMEAVFGAEQYNNGPEMTVRAASHNATLPFTRNVIGPMDYTPVTFTNSQYAHTTTVAHELALSVVFESAIQHFADRPEGYDNLPDAPKAFLRQVPASWDDTKFLDGYPGKSITLTRRKGNDWYLAGINGTDQGKSFRISLDFLKQGKNYRVVLIQDGEYDTAFCTQYFQFTSKDTLDVKWLPRGGFSAICQEIP